jgi:hypothetical protein
LSADANELRNRAFVGAGLISSASREEISEWADIGYGDIVHNWRAVSPWPTRAGLSRRTPRLP